MTFDPYPQDPEPSGPKARSVDWVNALQRGGVAGLISTPVLAIAAIWLESGQLGGTAVVVLVSSILAMAIWTEIAP